MVQTGEIQLKRADKLIWHALHVEGVLVGAIGMSQKIAIAAAAEMVGSNNGVPDTILLSLRGYKYSMSRENYNDMKAFFDNSLLVDELILIVEMHPDSWVPWGKNRPDFLDRKTTSEE